MFLHFTFYLGKARKLFEALLTSASLKDSINSFIKHTIDDIVAEQQTFTGGADFQVIKQSNSA